MTSRLHHHLPRIRRCFSGILVFLLVPMLIPAQTLTLRECE
ncbi:MAG: hypothetical protein ACOVSW_14750 [Candidatus Kapaibacteriota bacterium]